MEGPEKLEKLRRIPDEATLREKLLKPLFAKLGFRDVRITHGPQEDGKDLVFYEVDKFGRQKWIACVAKRGDISGAASGRGSIGEVNEQVQQAFAIQYPDAGAKRVVPIDRVVVVASGRISQSARQKIAKGQQGRPIEFLDGDDLRPLIDDHWPAYWALDDPALAEYFDHLQCRVEAFLDLRTLGCSTDRRFRDVFVDLSLEEVLREPSRVTGKRRKQSPSGVLERPKRLRSTELIEKPGGYVVVGEGGCGKTCILRNLALEQISINRDRAGQGPVPVLLEARDMVDLTVLKAIETNLDLPDSIDHLPVDLAEATQRGKLLVLIDGYDEITETADRKKLAQAVERFLAESPRSTLVVASRDLDEFELAGNFPGFKRLRVIPFSLPQVREFITHWFSEPETRTKLERGLLNSELAKRVPNTPLVLTMLAIVLEKKENKEVPANLTDLFQMYTELMLGKWDVETHRLKALVEYNISDRLLCEIAAAMTTARTLRFTRAEVIRIIDTFLESTGYEANSSTILRFLEERAGILSEIGGHITFRHHSIQSFFAARELHHNKTDDRALVERFLDPWWAEVIFFYAGTCKKCATLIDSVVGNLAPTNFGERLQKIVTTGGVVQAAYLTPYQTRKRAVRDAVDSTYRLYREIAAFAVEHQELPVSKIPRLIVLMICLEVFSTHFSSQTIRKALEESLREAVKDGSEARLFTRYALARALAMMGNNSELVRIASEIPPGFVRWQLAAAIDLERLTDGRGAPAKDAIAKVNRRIRSGRTQIKAELEESIAKAERRENAS